MASGSSQKKVPIEKGEKRRGREEERKRKRGKRSEERRNLEIEKCVGAHKREER